MFYENCFFNDFHKALGVNKKQFKAWLEGVPFDAHYISQISINNFFSIKQINLNFGSSKEIYFLGENGDGKSLLLMALYLAFNGNYIISKTNQEETGKAVDLLRKNKDMFLKGLDEFDREYNLQQANYIENIYAYGTHRGRYSSDTPEEYGFMSLFDFNKTLNDPITWLKNQKLLELENLSRSGNKDTKDSSFCFASEELENMFYELLERNVKVKIEGADVFFIEKDYKLNFEQLSEGYRSIIIFVSDLLFRLSSKIGKDKDVKSIKGVVFVDEIDLHLHPKWQRIIINKLRLLFPNIQFFFTTHSPTIIQGASEDAIVYRIYKENGITKASEPYLRTTLNHLMINTLLTSPLFGMDDSRLDAKNENSNTDDSYLLYRINTQLKDQLSIQRKQGKNFISEIEIDNIINDLINQELGNDKDR
jgi:predicted ATP-binding protein involved in virulence